MSARKRRSATESVADGSEPKRVAARELDICSYAVGINPLLIQTESYLDMSSSCTPKKNTSLWGFITPEIINPLLKLESKNQNLSSSQTNTKNIVRTSPCSVGCLVAR